MSSESEPLCTQLPFVQEHTYPKVMMMMAQLMNTLQSATVGHHYLANLLILSILPSRCLAVAIPFLCRLTEMKQIVKFMVLVFHAYKPTINYSIPPI